MVEQAETHVDLNFHAALRTLLADADAQVRRLAIEGLWEDEKPSLIPPLTRLLSMDAAAEVRAAAATSLGRYVYLGEIDEIAERHADAARVSSARGLAPPGRGQRGPPARAGEPGVYGVPGS